MKVVLSISLALFIALLSIGTAQADENQAQDTIAQQTKVLAKINEALTRGAITPDQSSDLKEQLNGIGASESWYKSIAVPVPQTVVKENTEKLAALNTQIDKQLPLNLSRVTTSTGGTTYGEISKLIGHAAASNKISNAQAEEYYTQLAQIENDAESLKNDPASSKIELSDLNGQLKLLKVDIQAKSSFNR